MLCPVIPAGNHARAKQNDKRKENSVGSWGAPCARKRPPRPSMRAHVKVHTVRIQVGNPSENRNGIAIQMRIE